MSKEAQSIENSFTEYIIPENEKKIVDSIFDQNMEPANKQSLMQVNRTTSNQTLATKQTRDQEHFSFLSRVQARAEKELQDEQKGIKVPLSGNRLTQKMYSEAKLEKDEQAAVSNETQKE